jgi:inositol-1,4,5-trisphosphate 5-phosphatase
MATDLRVMLITSNVGSAFEEPDDVQQIWLCELLEAVRYGNPQFLAVHLQELGGKNYESTMKDVRQLVRTIRDSDVLKEYDRMLALLDEDLETKETFTALGCLFFIHKSLGDVKLWNFKRKVFELISGNTVIGGNLEDSESHRKVKFPPDFFPEFKWSRKGFLQTKWSVCERYCDLCLCSGQLTATCLSRIFNLVNVHLFHDASNTIAMTKVRSGL